MTSHDLPSVASMRVRRFTPTGCLDAFGGVLVMDSYTVEDVSLGMSRLAYDEDVVDCSNRIVQITTAMIMSPVAEMALTVFPSRRWRNMRTGEQIDRWPDADHPLEYLGNPIRLFKDAHGIQVVSGPEFLIKTGVELGY